MHVWRLSEGTDTVGILKPIQPFAHLGRFCMLALHLIPRRARIAFVCAGLIALTACGGGASTGTAPVPNFGFCGNDTQYALARPTTGQSFASGTPTIEIVANGNNNTIAQSFQNFNLLLLPNNSSSNQVQTGPLTAASDPNGFHPFTSDFYYSGTVVSPGLFPGQQYFVYLNAFTSNCTPIGPIGSFFT